MQVVISADWHINKDNRLEDMERTLAELVQKVIVSKPEYFVFLGDAYKNWKPTPLEMNIFHRTIMDIASQGISVVIVVGNHDYPESAEYRGIHCYTELTTLVQNDLKYNINVVDAPSVWGGFCPGISAVMMPYLPKSTIIGTYEETFANVLTQQMVQVTDAKVILFSHIFLREAKIGNGDIEIVTGSQVSADILRKAGIDVAFCGDIHKAQCVQPKYFYPGSIERIDFGERDDSKGFISYDMDDGVVSFIELNARKLEQIVIDLVNPGFIKEAGDAHKDTGHILIQEPYTYIIELLGEKKEQLKDAVVKIKIICTKEQKSKMDAYETQMVTYLMDVVGIHRFRSISYELVDAVSVRNTDINESLNPVKAFHMWVGMQDYKGDIGQHIILAGENILKGHSDRQQ